jgi:uncharacterized protein YndB with AHSA1/START domain
VTDTVQVTRLLKAAPQDVFEAWTDPRILKEWLCPDPGVVGEVTCEPAVGGEYRLVMVFDHGAYVITGEYLEVEPPHRLVFTWLSDRTSGPTQVTVTLCPEGDLTEMTILHERLPSPAYGDSAKGAWTNALDHLEAVLAASSR